MTLLNTKMRRAARVISVRSRVILSNFFLLTNFKKNFLNFHMDILRRMSYSFVRFSLTLRRRYLTFRRRAPMFRISGVSAYRLIRPRAALKFLLNRNFIYQRRLTVFLNSLRTTHAKDFLV